MTQSHHAGLASGSAYINHLIPLSFFYPSYHSPLASSCILCTYCLSIVACPRLYSLLSPPLRLLSALFFALCLLFSVFVYPSLSSLALPLLLLCPPLRLLIYSHASFLPYTAPNSIVHLLYHLYKYLPYISDEIPRKYLLICRSFFSKFKMYRCQLILSHLLSHLNILFISAIYCTRSLSAVESRRTGWSRSFSFAVFSVLSFFCQLVGHVMRNFVDARRPHHGPRLIRNHGGAAHLYAVRNEIGLV